MHWYIFRHAFFPHRKLLNLSSQELALTVSVGHSNHLPRYNRFTRKDAPLFMVTANMNKQNQTKFRYANNGIKKSDFPHQQ